MFANGLNSKLNPIELTVQGHARPFYLLGTNGLGNGKKWTFGHK